MKTIKVFGIISIMAVIILSVANCFGQSFKSAEELKAYLDKQPVNGPDKPIKVSMRANDLMLPEIIDVLFSTGKYVSLNLSGNALTTIDSDPITGLFTGSFKGCETLVSITIPNSVTRIGTGVFVDCINLTGITVVSGNPNFVSEGNIVYNKAKTEIIAVPGGITGNVIIPNSVTSIKHFGFSDRRNLTGVTIPDSVTSIGQGAFTRCTGLASVTFTTGSNIIDDNFGKLAFPQGSDGKGGNTLKIAYSTGKAGTYTREANGSTWAKE